MRLPGFPSARTSAAIAGAALLALVAAAFASPAAVARGWLAAFAFWSGIPIGSLVLLLVHRLVGGHWGAALAPALRPLALLVPLIALAFVPVVIARADIFPWAGDPGAAPPDVARLYLNTAGFIVRGAVAIGGWSLFAWLIAQNRCSALMAAIALAVHGLLISVVSVDWILSVDAGFTSSAFPAGIAVQQILSALAAVAVIAPERPGDSAARDLAGLLIAALLGLVYIDYMAYVVAWYGDLPEKAAWYLRRSHDGWACLIAAAVIIGALLPFCLLLLRRVRASRSALRAVGALILIGIWLHVLWLTTPSFGPAAAAWSCLALIALAAVSAAAGNAIAGRGMRRLVHAA